jgi:type IV pilus assembly protein PilM
MHLLGAAPIPAPPHVFAMDGARLRYGQFLRDRQGFRCRALREAALPRDAFHSGLLGGPLRDPTAFQGIVGGLVRAIPGGVKNASLVIPDAWLRVAFSESGELPRTAEQRDEVLRWKLRRLVPFRVDELRVSAAEVPRLPTQEEPRRLLLGFAIEQLLAQIEDAFAAHGVRLGQISNASLSMLAALATSRADELTALAVVDDNGYSLVFVRRGSPILHRYKAFSGGLLEGPRAGFVVRDLKLTRNFLDEQLPGVPLARVLLAAPPEQEPQWVDLLAEGLGEPAAPLDGRHLPPLRSEEGTVPSWRELAPMLGAARQEVA